MHLTVFPQPVTINGNIAVFIGELPLKLLSQMNLGKIV